MCTHVIPVAYLSSTDTMIFNNLEIEENEHELDLGLTSHPNDDLAMICTTKQYPHMEDMGYLSVMQHNVFNRLAHL